MRGPWLVRGRGVEQGLRLGEVRGRKNREESLLLDSVDCETACLRGLE
jgi:hypothetical protein